MSLDTSRLSLILLPDGPVAHDGTCYRYSKGERLYLDNLAKDFKKIYIASFVIREGEEFYESLIHSKFQSNNIEIVELPKFSTDKPSIFMKLMQFVLVFKKILLLSRKVDAGYLFLPSYPAATAWLSLILWRKPYFIYGADDWVQASDSMFKWNRKKHFIFYKFYKNFNIYIEKFIVRYALFGVAAGGQLIEKYKNYKCPTYPTSPRMTLSSNDIFEREDTCINEQITLINVGSLINDKAQDMLIKSFAEVCNIYKDIRLKIVGEGPLRSQLVSLTRDLDIEENVIFCGYIEDEKLLYKQLSSSDIFVLSSVTEGFPRVLYEAMCMRLPIVTTNVGGISYLLKDMENALIVESQDIDAMTKAIITMIENSNLRRDIIKSANQTIDTVFKRMDGSQISKLLLKYW